MDYKLIFSSSIAPMDRPENAGFDLSAVEAELRSAGHTVELVDASSMSDADRYSIYLDEAIPAAGNRYRVGRPFGTNRHKGEDLGSYVPALFVSSAPGERPMDVYPHEELDGKVTTIADHLRDRRARRD
jgi:hypothetical protein